ncbi:MAG: hypothetical protein KAI24_22950, partial [Planctomycetes bacterium]|nr:hypothetical protein [Planctomycetota bacterium]
MRFSSCAGLLAILLAACHAVDPGLPPAAVRGMPWGEGPADRLAWTARQAVERGQSKQALVTAETILLQQPHHVDAHRLRQDVMRQRGRRGRLLAEARKRVTERPDDGHAHYLLARISEDPERKLAGFRRAAELAPESVWPWLGLA